jgi:hypothetical protein
MPVVFGVVIALMARRSCNESERTHATFVLNFGAAETTIKEVDAELWMNGDMVAQFHRAAFGEHLGPAKFEGTFPSTEGEMRVDVELRTGEHEHLKRTIHADENATVTVNLDDLR